MTLKDKLVMWGCSLGLVAVLLFSQDTNNARDAEGTEKTKSPIQQETKNDIYNQFKEKADTNYDGDLTEEELRDVYHKLDLKYSILKVDLTEEQMREYLELKKQLYLAY